METRTKVIITEENAEFCSQLEMELNKQGVELVCIPKDGIQVLESIGKIKPAIVIMDALMTHIDAVGVMRAYASATAGNPVFFTMINFSNQNIAKEEYDAGASYCFTKPVDLTMMVN